MSYRMMHHIRRLMCDKFSVLCTLAELNAKQLREDTKEDEVMNVKIKRLDKDAVIPKYAKEGDSGFDLVAAEDVIIEPGETVIVPTGLAFELPAGYEMQIRPRSGISAKTKLRVVLGTIDAGYRGEVGVIVDNIAQPNYYILGVTDGTHVGYNVDKSRVDYVLTVTNSEYIDEVYHPMGTYLIRKGDRICQAVIKPVEQATFVEVSELGATDRGEGGFGSSGVKS